MKKKLCSFLLMLLAFACVLGIPAAAANANAKVPLDLTYNTGSKRAADSDLFDTAYVRNKGASTGNSGTAKQIEVVVDLTGLGSSTNSVFAVVMRASDYESLLATGPGPSDVNATSYYNLAVNDRNYYASGRRNLSTGKDGKLVIPMAEPSAGNDGILANDSGSVASKNLEVPTPVGTNYYHEYVLFVFGEKTGAADGSDLNLHYYIDRFYMDAKGYVYTPSYMIRYNANNPNIRPTTYTVGSLPDTQVQRAAWNDDALGTGKPGNVTLSGNTPTRIGYKFLGWTTTQKDPLPADQTLQLPMEGFYEKSATFNEPAILNTVYDLYAYWQVVPVQFAAGDGTDTDGFKYLNFNDATGNRRYPQFGVGFSTVSALGQPSDGNSEPGGTKTYSVKTYKDGVADASPNLYGLAVGANGNATQQKFRWGITGTPTSHSDGKPVVFEITVTDQSNNTTDVIRVNFKKVEKGAQPIPTLDGVTGLKSQIVDEDGQLIGFYASGPVLDANGGTTTGYLPVTGNVKTGTNGVNGQSNPGTMTGYYIDKRMIYEYRPKGIDYTNLPNDGWREVPMPSNWYGENYISGTLRQQFLDSLKLQATTVITTGYNTSLGSHAPVTVVTDLPEGFAETGWPENYGYIEFDGTLPIIHGLTADAAYEVRFRENTNNAVSETQTITIGGAVGGGGGSGGLAVNLAGGDIQSEDLEAYTAFVEQCHGMSPGDSIEIPSFIPVRENYSFAGWTLDVKDEESKELILYNYDAEAETPISVTLGDKPTALAAVWTATPDGFVTIVCYDWDETLLGSVTVPKGASESVAQGYMRTFERSLMSPESKDYDDTKEAYFVDDAAKPLTYKRGYSFLTWLPNDSDLPTHCGRAVTGTNAAVTIPNPKEEGTNQQFGGLTSNITVKACYIDNSELYYNPDDLVGMQYTIKQSYSRIATSATYSITVSSNREHIIDGEVRGVPRMVEPQLRAQLTTNTGVYNFFTLSTADATEFTVYPTTAVSTVSCVLVDFFNAANKTAAADKSNTITTPYTNASSPREGFGVLGNIGLINEQLAANDQTYLTPPVMRTGAGLTLSAGGYTVDRVSLRDAWLKKNSLAGDGETLKDEQDWVGLTWDEMQHAINTGGDWPIP